MLTLLFVILMIVVIGKIAILAMKAAWGITKVIFTVVLFPIFLIAMAVSEFMALAFIALIIGGLAALVASAVA